MAEFVIPDELKQIITEDGDVGDSDFMVRDSATGEDAHDRIIIFSSYGMRQRAAISKELHADGTYRTISNIFWTLYTIHGDVDETLYPIFPFSWKTKENNVHDGVRLHKTVLAIIQ